MDYTRLIAVSYPDPDRTGKKIIRVYYQVGRQIRESCYDDGNGWYVRASDDVVATNVRQRSPIAATNIDGGKKTSVFYLDGSNKLCRRIRVTTKAGERGAWQDGTINVPHSIAAGSQLTAVRTDEDNQNIRVFYQSADNKIRGVISYGDDGTWNESDLVLDNALAGTSLCAISGNSQTRLYLQDKDKTIKEYYSDTDTQWHLTRIKQYTMDANAPITTVAWNYGTNNLQIRLFTLLNKALIEVVYNKARGGWAQGTSSTNQFAIRSDSPYVTSALTSTALEQEGDFTVFYQPSINVVAQFNSTMALAQLGIPTARE